MTVPDLSFNYPTSVWTQNADGSNGATWWIPSPPYQFVITPSPPPLLIDTQKVQALVMGRGNSTEQLRAPYTNGQEVRITLVARDKGKPIMFSRILQKGERDRLTEAIESHPLDDLQFSRPLSHSPLALWEFRDAETGKPRRILQNLPGWSDPVGDTGKPLTVATEREIKVAPATIVRTPANRLLWFGFSTPGEPDAGQLTIMKSDGTLLGEIDLLKLGGYAHPSEAKKWLRYGEIQFLRNGRWGVPLENERDPRDTDETFQILGRQGRIQVKISKSGVQAERSHRSDEPPIRSLIFNREQSAGGES